MHAIGRRFALALAAVIFGTGPAGVAVCQPSTDGPLHYVIVTPDSLVAAFAPLALWKSQTGVPAAVVGLDEIRLLQPFAADDAERVRRFLADAHGNRGLQWVLLGGDASQVPVRYATTAFFGGHHLPTDLYYSGLAGDWNANGDSLWGEGAVSASDPGDDADLTPDVYVGRAPVRSAAEARAFVARTLAYERAPAGDYESSMLMSAEVLFPVNWAPGNPILFDGVEIAEALLPSLDALPALDVTRLYENTSGPGQRPGALPESRTDVLAALGAGVNLMLGVGNGDATHLGAGDAPLTSADMTALTNAPHYFNLYAVGDVAAAFDGPSLGSAALLAPEGGAVTCIGQSLAEFPTATRAYLKEFWRLIAVEHVRAVGEAQALAKLPFVPLSLFDSVNRWTQMGLTLLGDPELRLWIGTPATLGVTAPEVLFSGDSAFDVVVALDHVPLPGARVTAWSPYRPSVSALTDALGRAHVSFAEDLADSITLTVTAPDCRPDQRRIAIVTLPTPTEASLMSMDATSTGVSLIWEAPGHAGQEVHVERRREGEPASIVASGAVDGNDRFAWTDRDVIPGARYAYALSIRTEAGERRVAERWVDVPFEERFGLQALAPNPAHGGFIEISFALPDGAPAVLELVDVSGRRVQVAPVGSSGAGVHRMRFELRGAMRSGVYFARLSQSGHSSLRRFAVVR